MADGRREETRQRLVEAAFVLFEDRGFDNVTVDEIATAAGVSRRTYFRHFKTKEKVVFPYTDSRLDTFREVIRSRTGGKPATFAVLRDVFGDVVQGWIDSRDRMVRSRRIVTQSSALRSLDYEVNAKWERVIALEIDGVAMGRPESDAVPTLRSRVIAGILVGAMRPVFERWYELDGQFDLEGEGRRALKVAEFGLKSIDEYFEGRNPVV